MGNYLNIGNTGFAAARKGTYVDKTGMISFVNSVLGTKDKLVCVSRQAPVREVYCRADAVRIL